MDFQTFFYRASGKADYSKTQGREHLSMSRRDLISEDGKASARRQCGSTTIAMACWIYLFAITSGGLRIRM